MKNFGYVLLACFLHGYTPCASALRFDIEPGNDLVGQIQTTEVAPGEDFVTLSRKYQVGYHELEEANPDLDPLDPGVGEIVIIPSRFILPHHQRVGMVINLAELRMYYFPPGKPEVYTYPIGIGKSQAPTPLGTGKVTGKQHLPTWHVPPSILKEQAAQGNILPAQIPPGPDNPLGDFALRTSFPTYLIHGTNAPAGVGLRSSHGCIRLYPENIQELFHLVSIGTPIRIHNDSFKMGVSHRGIYLESAAPLQEFKPKLYIERFLMKTRLEFLSRMHHIPIDWDMVHAISHDFRNIPYNVSLQPVVHAQEIEHMANGAASF